jgi:hypothetical protein
MGRLILLFKEIFMEENQKLGPSEVKCWQCGAAVYKGTPNCPKCGAPGPTGDIVKLRKMLPVFLCVGIVSLIAGIVMFIIGFNFEPSFLYSLCFSCLLIIGVIFLIISLGSRLFLAKVDKAKRDK